MLPVTRENRLPVVMDQRKVEILEGAELKKEFIFFLEAKFLPLVGLNLMDKTATGVIRNLIQKGGKWVGIRYRHHSSI